MSKNNSLKNDFPLLFSKNPKFPINSFGFECDDGWYDILHSAFYLLYTRYSTALVYEKTVVNNLKNFGKYYENYHSLHSLTWPNKDLYHHLLDSIQKAKKETLKLKRKLPKIDQVKEKYGSLRIYYTGGDQYATGIISFAEYLSETTCEICGQKSRISSTYKKSLCEDHANRRYF